MATIRLNNTNNIAAPTQRRDQIITLPPFSYPGEPEEDSESGRFFSRVGITLLDVVLTSRTVGTTNSSFQLLRKNPLSNGVDSDMAEELVFDTLTLTPTKRYLHRVWNAVVQPARVGFHPTNARANIQMRPGYQVDSANWISVKCSESGGHEDIVLTFTGVVSNTGWVEVS